MNPDVVSFIWFAGGMVTWQAGKRVACWAWRRHRDRARFEELKAQFRENERRRHREGEQ